MENAGLKLRLHIALLAGLAVIPAMAQTAQLTGDILDSTGAVVTGRGSYRFPRYLSTAIHLYLECVMTVADVMSKVI